MYFLQTSAKSCDNVDRLFTEIAHELLQQVFIFGQYWAFNIRQRCCSKKIFGRNLKWKCLQAKTKDLPSESHSVQNISDPIGQNTSQVKQNCCSKVFWTLAFPAFSGNSLRLPKLSRTLWFLGASQTPRMPGNTSALSQMQKKMHIWKIFPIDKPPIRMNSSDPSSF